MTSKDDPRSERMKKMYNSREPHNIGIQIKLKELTKTFMMISKWNKPFDLYGLYSNISAL